MEEAGKYAEKIKCRTNPSDATSTTYEIPMAYFKEGTPEEWLIFMDRLGRCITGQNATSGQAKFSLTRRLLDGAAKTAFENAAQLQGAHTNAAFQECLHAVTMDVFPPKALLNQKRFMRRFLRKNQDMRAKDYIARVCEIHSYLPLFPTNSGREAEKLPTDELLDLLEFGVPLKWQRDIHLHGFEPQEGLVKDFAAFCERLESSLEDTESKHTKKTGSSEDTPKNKGDNDRSNGKRKRGRDRNKNNDDKEFFLPDSRQERFAQLRSMQNSQARCGKTQKRTRAKRREEPARV